MKTKVPITQLIAEKDVEDYIRGFNSKTEDHGCRVSRDGDDLLWEVVDVHKMMKSKKTVSNEQFVRMGKWLRED